jgi:hypothetical protein
MKHNFLLSALAAIVIFAAATTAEAGIFGRLSTVWNGCNPCEQVAACQPCEPIAEVACNPCDVVACDPCASDCGLRPFRPLGGLFVNLKAKLATPCCATECNPCEAVAAQPCEPVCDPCAADCDPCGSHMFSPFGGLFANLGAKLGSPCGAAGCEACEPVCEPCASCKW